MLRYSHMLPGGILFFADRLAPNIGGMEMHAEYFIKHFAKHKQFPLLGVITKGENQDDLLICNNTRKHIKLKELRSIFAPTFIFYNSGRWIEELQEIKGLFPKVIMLYRTGGNEVLKAPLEKNNIDLHKLRQDFWVNTINETINFMITNSSYTEARLSSLGILCPFVRCVGGVNTAMLKKVKPKTSSAKPINIFCAARFVPYKNHVLLLQIISNLVERGHFLHLRLAGDGPLLEAIQKQAQVNNLAKVVDFLGVLDNENTCMEIANADIYMQLSTDYLTEVPGGSYIHAEGMGRSILEAITAGTFVIAGKSGALSEIVTRDRGILVELNNVAQITLEVERVLQSLPGNLKFTDQYDWDNYFNQYEKLLKNSLCKYY